MNTNTNEPVGRYISQLYRKGRSFISKELSQQGFGSGQFVILIQLYKEDGISQEELSEQLTVDKTTIARAIKKLEEEGFVIRLKDEADKRAYKIYLTDKAKENKEILCAVLRQWEDNLLENITQDEKDTLIRILKKLCV